MRIINIRLPDLVKEMLPVGFTGENRHTQVRIDCAALFAEYPRAVPCMTVVPPAGTAYPAFIAREGDAVVWEITGSDLAHEGIGRIQLSFTVDGVIAKSCIGQILVGPSLFPEGEMPDPLEDWLLRAEAALGWLADMPPVATVEETREIILAWGPVFPRAAGVGF